MESPVEVLQKEHRLLRQVVQDALQFQIISDDETYHSQMQRIIGFFSNYMDWYHHPKEEIIHHYLLATKNRKFNSDTLQVLEAGRDDLDQLIADIVDAHMRYDVRNLRVLMEQYLNELSNQMDEEENLVLPTASALLSLDESEMIAREFAIQDTKDGLMQGLINHYYKFTKHVV